MRPKRQNSLRARGGYLGSRANVPGDGNQKQAVLRSIFTFFYGDKVGCLYSKAYSTLLTEKHECSTIGRI